MVTPGSRVAVRLRFGSTECWCRALVLEEDSDHRGKCILAAVCPENAEVVHFSLQGMSFVLTSATTAQIRQTGPDGVLLPPFGRVFREYLKVVSDRSDVEFLSATDREETESALAPAAPRQAASAPAKTVSWPSAPDADDGDEGDEERPALAHLEQLAAYYQSLLGRSPATSSTPAAPAMNLLGPGAAPSPYGPGGYGQSPWPGAGGLNGAAAPPLAPGLDCSRGAAPAACSWAHVQPPRGPCLGGSQLSGPWGPTPAASPFVPAPMAGPGLAGHPPGLAPGADFNTVLQLEILRVLGRRQDEEGVELLPSTEGGARGVERSLRTLHSMKARVRSKPQSVIVDYVQRVKEHLGVYPGQVWSLADHNRRIPWGRHKTLQRLHFLLTEVFALQDSGRHLEAQALVVQGLKACHQCQLDDGNWKTAWHLTTLRDPLAKQQFGGNERELEAIAAYSKAIEDLETRMRRDRDTAHDEKDEPKEEGGRGRGRGRGQPKAAP